LELTTYNAHDAVRLAAQEVELHYAHKGQDAHDSHNDDSVGVSVAYPEQKSVETHHEAKQKP
jgi:hypothetical protein